ncbi:NUDIX domain-containing protein [Salipiger sp.]|uniref:NUDIX domain-containing protein n=1 Tax=Salipiger sp. TaxID=2078585 RepID=UPI003A9884E7
MRRFVFGALAWPPLLERVLGRAADLRPARLPGYAVYGTGGGALDPGTLCAVPEGGAAGLLILDPDPEDGARMAYFNGTDADGMVTEVRCGGDLVSARVALHDDAPGDGAPPWDQARWLEEWGPLALDTARNIMAQYGQTEPARMAGLRPYLAARAWARQLARTPAPAEVRMATTAEEGVEILRERPGHEGFFRLRAFDMRHRRFDGAQSPEIGREGFVAYDAALVLPYDPATDHVLLIEQLRYGPILRGDPRPWVLEPVAGLVDAGEDPETCVLREAVEEAGLTLREVKPMVRVYASPGYSSEFFHCYLGLADLSSYEAGVGGLDAEHEDIRSHLLSFDRAMALVDSGEINAGPLAMMLLWLARARAGLRAGA